MFVLKKDIHFPFFNLEVITFPYSCTQPPRSSL